MKKLAAFTFLLIFCFANSTCKKKISKYPFDMHGVWFAEDLFCGSVLVIEKSGDGKLFGMDDGFCVTTTDVKGKVKYKGDVLYIGNKKYTMFDEPRTASGQDSIMAPDENNFSNPNFKMRRVLATMKIQEKGIVSFNQSFTLHKYVQY